MLRYILAPFEDCLRRFFGAKQPSACLQDKEEQAMVALHKYEEAVMHVISSTTHEPVPVMAMLPYYTLAPFLKYLYDDIEVDTETEERFTKLFYAVSEWLREETNYQLENKIISEKEVQSLRKILSLYFTEPVRYKVQHNKWILALIEEYPDLYFISL